MRMFVVLVVMLAAILGFWWNTWSHINRSAAQLAQYRQDIDTLQKQVAKTEQALSAIEGLRREIAEAKKENEMRLMEAASFCGNERLDYLERMLREDACRRAPGGDAAAPAGAAGAVR